MEFKVKQTDLAPELAFVTSVVDKGSSVSSGTSSVLIESQGKDSVKITGTDLDISLSCIVPATVITEGSMCAHGSRLFNIIRYLGDEDVTFKRMANGWADVRCGKAKLRVAGTDVDKFPQTPVAMPTTLQINSDVFADFIHVTGMASTDSRPTLNGAQLQVTSNYARMTSTDGHRVSIAEKELDENDDRSLLVTVPRKALSQIVQIAKGLEDDDILIGHNANHIYFNIGTRTMFCRKVSGAFPDCQAVIPTDNPYTVTFDAEEMRNALLRASVMADARTKAIKLVISHDRIALTCQSVEEGNIVDEVSANCDSPDDITIGFNYTYILDFLKTVNTKQAAEQVSVTIKDGKKQVLFGLPDRTDYRTKYVVVPLSTVL